MTELSERRRIPAPLDAVWDVLDDIDTFAEWGETTLAVVEGGGRGALGSEYVERNKVFGPLTTKSRWKIVEHDPPHRAVHRSENVASTRWFDAVLDAAPAGDATDVTITFRYEPSMGRFGRMLDALVFRKTLPGEMRGSLESIERLALTRHAATRAAAEPVSAAG